MLCVLSGIAVIKVMHCIDVTNPVVDGYVFVSEVILHTGFTNSGIIVIIQLHFYLMAVSKRLRVEFDNDVQ